MFSVNYMPAPGSTVVGSLISLYFQVGSLSVASITASNFALTPSALFTTSPSKVAPSAVPSQGNLNGTAFPNASDWTFAILFDKKDNIGAERSLSFDLSATGLDLIDFTRLGLRIQRVGSPGVDPGQRGGSDKLIGIDPTLTSTVPVPAAGLMLLGALGGLAALRRRRKAA